MSTLKDRFAELQRDKPAITQADIARVTGAKPPSVNAWFSGETKTMKLITAIKTAELYGVNPLWLAEGDGPKIGASVAGPLSQVALMDLQLQIQVKQIAILLNAITPEKRAAAYASATDLLISFLPTIA